jgi:hypothetical protein
VASTTPSTNTASLTTTNVTSDSSGFDNSTSFISIGSNSSSNSESSNPTVAAFVPTTDILGETTCDLTPFLFTGDNHNNNNYNNHNNLPVMNNDTCRVGVLAPYDLQAYGLVDNHTFCSTLTQAQAAAQKVLGGACAVDVRIQLTHCTLRSTLQAAYSRVFSDWEVWIGPPCSTRELDGWMDG